MSEPRPGDPRTLTLAQVAEAVGGTLRGASDVTVRGVAPISEAGPEELGFLALRRYVRHLDGTRAGALLVAEELADHAPPDRPCVTVPEPYPALRTLLLLLHPSEPMEPGVHPTAVIGRGARLGDGVAIGPYAVVGAGARLGDASEIGAHAVVGRGARLGAGCVLHPHAVVYPGAHLGDRVTLHSGVRVGSDGFGYTLVDGAHRKVPQVGGCVIGDDVEIGANSTVDRGSIGDTVVGEGVKIDNLVQVAHNVRVGAHSMMAALVGIAGSTRIGEHVWMGGQVSAINHLEIGDRARLAFASTVMRDVGPDETVSGSPARPHRESLRKLAHLERLPRLQARVQALEDRLARLESGGSE